MDMAGSKTVSKGLQLHAHKYIDQGEGMGVTKEQDSLVCVEETEMAEKVIIDGFSISEEHVKPAARPRICLSFSLSSFRALSSD